MDVQDFAGQTIKGYELTERIGAGGFGAVYRAYQPLIKREVAVKVILPDFTNNPEFIRRFEAEAQLVANLEHPHIVPLYDYWRDARGAFLIMRYLRGGSMKAILTDGHWTLNDIPRVLDQITGALAVAHRNGVIHRDIKPENILLDEDRNAYLADFGIAKDLNRITDAASFIEEIEDQRMVGSPEFMSPEQIQSTDITPQTDIYNMGIVLYMMLTGRKPFDGPNLSTIITKHLFEPFPHIQDIRPDLPSELNRVIEQATEKDPADRYKSITDLAEKFREALRATSTAEFEQIHSIVGADFGDSNVDVELVDTIKYEEVQFSSAEPENPYKGLRAFGEADADDFYGRTGQVKSLLERLDGDDVRSRFLVLIGASGSGKSSLVRAGVLPSLRRGGIVGSDRWFITDMTPGSHPLEELEAALLRVAVNPPPSLLEQLESDERGLSRAVKRVLPSGDDADTELVVLIDQFEEVFTHVNKKADGTHFLKMLTAAANDPKSRLRIIVTMRADFYDRPLMYPDFGALVRECSEVILPLNRDELQLAIVEPARAKGLTLEEGLVTAIVADVSDQPGMLPMVQYSLTELFERRDGLHLTRAAYEEIGGVTGALARRAEEIYGGLSDKARALARQIFVRLVSLGEGSEDTRRRAQIGELLSLDTEADAVQMVLDAFGNYRLLTFDHDPSTRNPTVEVAHEALIRQWDRFRRWLDESRDELRTQRQLNILAREWTAAKGEASYLVSGARLENFEVWHKETSLAITPDEHEFIKASAAARDAAQHEEAARVAHEKRLQERSRTVLRALVAVMTIAAFVGVALTLVAFDQRQTAQSNAATAVFAGDLAVQEAERAATSAAIAVANEREARSLAFVAGSQAASAENDAEFALLLAIEAVSTQNDPTLQALRTLAQAAYTPATRRLYSGHEDRVEAIVFTSDGRQMVSGGDDGLVLLWDTETGEINRRMEGHTDFVWDVAVSADDTLALSASADGTAILWDLETGDLLHTLAGHEDDVGAVAFGPDGSTALTGGHDALIIQWDLETGQPLAEFGVEGSGHAAAINDIVIGDGGFTALSASEDGSVILWSLAAGLPVQRYQGEGGGIYSVHYTVDELGFFAGSFDGTLEQWSFEIGLPILKYEGHTDRVTGISLSSDGRQMASSSQDGTAILWDVALPTPRRLYLGHTDRVYDVAFHPTEPRFVTAGWDRTLRLWDTINGAELKQTDMLTDAGLVTDIAPDGRLAAAGSADGTVLLWDTETGVIREPLTEHTDAVFALAFTPDGAGLLTAGDDTRILLWDTATGALVREFTGGHQDGILALDVSPDGSRVVTGSRDSTAIIWDIETGAPLNRLFGHTFQILSSRFSPDGSRIVTAGRDYKVIIWDVESGEEIRTFDVHNDWVFTAVYSPDGTQILSGGGENNLILWDAASGQPLRTFEGHTSFIYSSSFSPDGQYAASSAADSTVIVWNLETGDVVRQFTTHMEDVRSVVYTPDGDLLTVSGDETMRLWQVQLTVQDLLGWIAENRHIRDYTCAERDQFNIKPLCPPATPVFDPDTI